MKKAAKITVIITLFMFMGKISFSQIPNLINFDKKTIHFGILIGYNQMYFDLTRYEQTTYSDTLFGINSFQAPGFQVAIISDLRLCNFLNLRFTPGLQFSQKRIDYFFKTNTTGVTKNEYKNVESVYADLPFELKIRSKRWRDFRPYLIAGARYTFDLASLRKLKDVSAEEAILKMSPHDFLITGGTGFDFYLTDFKFGIEFKMSYGFHNLLVDANNIYTNDLKRINSRLFNITLTFE